MRELESDLENVKIRLATYGTLAPGRPNHHQLADLQGSWQNGTVRGWLVAEGWGASLGYPGLILDDAGDTIEVQVFESADLPFHWSRLDEFEGPGYQRVTAVVEVARGRLPVSLYVLARA
ncbi:gamma-glutamylcyclotransferase [Deinococcus sp. YIM 134068]|uniref:gamma-glutamylcyclotransferase n=1 Tax=Deinococcus lichenicola TaxID=3118910 RepID=UPI002F928EC6